jgi:hypothetical protein
MVPTLTLLWTTLIEGEFTVLDDRIQAQGGEIVQVTLASLPTRIVSALAKGAVIVVARGDREAGLALSIGADEVLRTGEIDAATVDSTIQRARARAGARAARDSALNASQVEDWTAFALLAAALGSELSAPLMVASTNCEMLSAEIVGLLRVTDELVAQAASGSPDEHERRLVAMRAAAPSSSDIHDMFIDVRISLQRAVSLVRALREVAFDSDGVGAVPVGEMVRSFSQLLSGYLGTWARLSVEAKGPCIARVARPALTYILAALIAKGVDSIRESGRRDGRIQLRAFTEEDCVVLEIVHNGTTPRTDFGATLVDTTFRTSSDALVWSDYTGIRERVRQAGYELLVDSDDAGTTARLLLPTGAAPAYVDVPQGWSNVRRNPARSD